MEAAAAVDRFASRPQFARSDADLCGALTDLQALSGRVSAAIASLVHEAVGRELPRQNDATSAVAWLRDLLRIEVAEARLLVTLGALLNARPALNDAVWSGGVNPGQVQAIGRVLTDVPVDEAATNAPTVDKVESTLIEHAGRFEPATLRRLGERILAHVDPELADRRLRDRLDREERRARSRRGFTLSADGLGGTRVSGTLDAEGAAIVAAAIDPLSGPTKGADGPDARTPATRRADALVEVCRIAMAAGGLPDNGGIPPQLNVTVNFDALARGVAIGQLDTGALLSPESVRRLACDAGILPVVLDGASVPIDVGRGRRLYHGAARVAVAMRDGGCAFPGCDRPIRWCDVHHVIAWHDGGFTDLENGVALCRHHHRTIHRGEWQVRMGKDRRPEFIPPAHVDPDRRPCRNPYHPRR
jgi:hypothetical protein